MSRRGGIYCRMSRAKGAHKIEAQEEMCRELASRHGISVERVYVDDGLSALGHLNRPG